jgi:hypothetical protein
MIYDTQMRCVALFYLGIFEELDQFWPSRGKAIDTPYPTFYERLPSF